MKSLTADELFDFQRAFPEKCLNDLTSEGGISYYEFKIGSHVIKEGILYKYYRNPSRGGPNPYTQLEGDFLNRYLNYGFTDFRNKDSNINSEDLLELKRSLHSIQFKKKFNELNND